MAKQTPPAEDEDRMAVEVMPPAPPTMDEAFHTLCRAMAVRLDENEPARLHCDDIRGWYANGNHVVAWTHAVQLLEGVLGATLHA